MNLADMLSYADIDQLHRIAAHYDCDCNTHSKRELIQGILNKVSRKEVFERYVEQLPIEDIRFLNSLLFDQREAFSLEELLARAKISRHEPAKPPGATAAESAGPPPTAPLPGRAGPGWRRKKPLPADVREAPWSPRDTIVRFSHHGWLFHGLTGQTKFLFQVPADLKQRFGDTLSEAFRKNVRTVEEPPAYRDEQQLLVEDVGVFVRHIDRVPLELTSDGTLYKRSQQLIIESFHIREELVGKGGWRFGYGRKIREYPNRFSLIYDYCYYSGLIDDSAGELKLTDKGKAFVKDDRTADPGEVYRFWLKLYRNPIHNVQSITHWIDRLAAKWVTLDTLSGALAGLIKPFYYDSPESILRHRIVQMMLHQGLLRVGEHPDAGAVVQMTKLGSSIVRGMYVPEEDKIVLPSGGPSHIRGRTGLSH